MRLVVIESPFAGDTERNLRYVRTGQRKLTHTERVTFSAIPDKWTPTPALLLKFGGKVKATALCNRLVDLKRIGLVECRECETNYRIKEWRRIP